MPLVPPFLSSGLFVWLEHVLTPTLSPSPLLVCISHIAVRFIYCTQYFLFKGEIILKRGLPRNNTRTGVCIFVPTPWEPVHASHTWLEPREHAFGKGQTVDSSDSGRKTLILGVFGPEWLGTLLVRGSCVGVPTLGLRAVTQDGEPPPERGDPQL
jgi:hypothetical protein